jgi:hypothetical protein
VSALQPTIAHAEENSVTPKSGLVKLSGSSGPILTAVAGCAINIGLYFLIKAINEIVDDDATDLMNIRDEILGNLNQLKYLLTLV